MVTDPIKKIRNVTDETVRGNFYRFNWIIGKSFISQVFFPLDNL
ncbi:hypothetical protein [Lentibacillus daqui]|nr:hypothetical protein [Lentibacillus daqui]